MSAIGIKTFKQPWDKVNEKFNKISSGESTK